MGKISLNTIPEPTFKNRHSCPKDRLRAHKRAPNKDDQTTAWRTGHILTYRLTVNSQDLWLAKDNRFLNPKISYERILMAPPCRLIPGLLVQHLKVSSHPVYPGHLLSTR